MKAADIQAGLDYAVGNAVPGHWLLRRAKVVAVKGGGRVLVSLGTTHEATVASREIVCTWREHEAAKRSREERERALRADRSAAATARNEAAVRLLDLVPSEALPWWAKNTSCAPHADWSGINGGRGEVTTTDLLRVVEAALAQHQRQVDEQALRTSPLAAHG